MLHSRRFRRLLAWVLCALCGLKAGAQQGAGAPAHWPLREHPGELPMDFWGWDYSVEHYRYVAPFHAGAKEVRTIMGQSADWGANTVDVCYGFYTIGNDALTGGDGTDPVAGSARGQGYWTLKENLDFNAELHRRGMTIHWIPNSMWLQRPDFADFIATMEGIARDQMDALHQPWEQQLDGMGMEQMWLFPPGLASRLFQAYNPGTYLYFLESSGWREGWPNVMYGLATGGGAQDEVTVGRRLGRGVQKSNGMETMVSQIEAIEYVGLDNQCSLARPDWVQESLHDTLRPSFMDPRSKTYTGLWYVMAPNLAPDGGLARDGGLSPESAHRAQAMSIDPVRSAWAGRLDATGADGRKETFRRLELPASTGYVQNNFLRLHIFAEKSGGQLLYDPTRSAHFVAPGDSEFGAPLVLAEDFMETVVGTTALTLDLDPLKMTFEQPGGFYAKLRTQGRWVALGGPTMKSEETRSYSTVSDSPFIRVQTEFLQYNHPTPYASRIKTPHYDQLETAGGMLAAAATIDLPSTCVLSDSTGKVPPLALLVQSTKPTKLIFSPGESVKLEYAATPRRHSTDVIALVLDGLYTRQDLGTLGAMLREEPEERQLEASQTQKVENPYPLPMVKVLKVNGIHERPYLVEENGWWMTRGAQLCEDESNAAYLKLYLPANGSARFRPFDFIEGSVKPGWGCQYTLAIREVQPDPASLKPAQREVGTSCTVQVLRVTPMLFAPRVQIGHAIAGVLLDGKPWHYFDDTMVFLPNRPGTYKLQVRYGHAETPHITRTMAVIDATEWDGRTLKARGALPLWMQQMPQDAQLTAAVEHGGRWLSAVEGCDLLRATTATASIVRFDSPAGFSLAFDATPAGAPEPISVQADIAAYLSREQARDLQPWLAGREAELVDVEDIAAGKVDLSRYGALLYNQFYLDELPQGLWNERVLGALRGYVQGGGGLMLFSRAAALAHQLGLEPEAPQTAWISPHSLNYFMDDAALNGYGFVPRPGESGDPLFAGLKAFGGDWLPITSHDMMSAVRIKGWAEERLSPQARVLADLRLISTRPHEAPPAMPALVEWELGKGRVLACAFNMFWTFSDRENWLPSKGLPLATAAQADDPATPPAAAMGNNGLMFMRNALNHLGGEGDEKPIGLLCW